MSYQQALDYVERGEFSTALALLDRVILTNGQHPEAYELRGRIRLKIGNSAGAIADYTKVIQRDPTALAYLARALAYVTTPTPSSAILDAQQALKLDPTLAAAQRLLGKVHRQMGQQHQAMMAYKAATKLYLAQKDKTNAADCLAQANQLQAELNKPVVSPSPGGLVSPTDYLQRAREKVAQGFLRQALDDLNWLLGMEPEHGEALCDRAYVQAQMHRYEAATRDLAKVQQLAPEDPQIQVKRAKIRLALGDAYGAMTALTALIKTEATVDRLALRGQAYQQLGDGENAFKDYSNAIAMGPTAELYGLRASVQSGKEALEDYRQAASLWLDQGNWQAQKVAADRAEAIRQELDREKAETDAGRVVRVPIKAMQSGMPVIEVRFNDRQSFDMVMQQDLPRTIITGAMAARLEIKGTPGGFLRIPGESAIPISNGWVRSMRVQAAVAMNVHVAIAANFSAGLLGQDFLANYDVRILANEVELCRREP
ncbi:tetratricopeptide repeat protein [Leptothoe kymatousa]|uniref:Tetratricopeptide repeat protein n=1 Tax=Leptothoe kymatousa TAU-MAC 1615 TaxID=2364775 RepID=A0ABS5Y703_9CYAN|nr:tetratricopeptide repeat protein [Leptothoe kymatousa]MBT9313616.1 tetratricopeptide repeat protein [Leptothoe kymatousa TAU-MAC 1615]